MSYDWMCTIGLGLDFRLITLHDCTRGKVIGSVVVVVVADTNFGISQHQGTCATCKCHVGVATGGKLAPAPSNRFNIVCSICHLSDAFCGPPFFARNVKWRSPNRRQLCIYIHLSIVEGGEGSAP